MSQSLVLELQRDALDPAVRVSDLLRKSVVVASKLGIAELGEWAERELEGFTGVTDVPPYRHVRGELKAHNPYQGWIPVILRDKALREKLETRIVGQPISALEEVYAGADGSTNLQMALPQEILISLFGDTEEFRLGLIPTLVFGKGTLRAVLDAIRNEVLRWALELERRGIVGEAMSFTPEEKARAAGITFNINTFSGVLGTVTSSNVVVGDYASIHSRLKAAGVPQIARNELEALLDEARAATPDKRGGVLARGMQWLSQYGPAIGDLSDTIRGWFEVLSSGA